MSWKSFACVAALSAIFAAPALAVPSLSFVDNLDGTVTLQVTPSGTGSIATEIAVTADNDLTSAVIADAVTFDTDNPGNNPQTGTVTNGLVNDLGNDQLFASNGSIVLNSATAVSYLTIGYTGTGTISAAGLVAEGAVNFTDLSASIMVGTPPLDNGDFDMDGDVDGDDFGVFVGQFGNMNGGPPFDTADFDMDGDVDGDDFGVFVGNFGNGVPATAIPEPTTAVMMMVGLAALVGTSRKS